MPSDPSGDRLKFYCMCGKKFWSTAELSGKKFRCRKCGRTNQIPSLGLLIGPKSSPPRPAFDFDGPPSGIDPRSIIDLDVAEDSPTPTPPRSSLWDRIGATLSGAALLAFLVYVIQFGPDHLSPFKVHLLAVLTAITAGMFAYFFSGSLNVNLTKNTKLGAMTVRSTGGAAAFVLVLVWWAAHPPITPAPPAGGAEAKATQAIESALQGQMARFTIDPDGTLQVMPALADLLPDDVEKNLIEFRTARSPYLRGLVALTEGRPDDARREFDEAEEKQDADLVKINLARARVDRRQERWLAAAGWYDKVIAAGSNEPVTLNEAGINAHLAGDPERGQKLLNEAADRLNKELGGAYTGRRDRAQLLADVRLNIATTVKGHAPADAEKQVEGAVQLLKDLGEPDPLQMAHAYALRGFLRIGRNSVVEAGADLQSAIKRYEAGGPAYRGPLALVRRTLATILYPAQGKFAQAVEVCEDLIKTGTEMKIPDHLLAGRHYDLANVHLKRTRSQPDDPPGAPPADQQKYVDLATKAVETGLALARKDSPEYADGLERKAQALQMRVELTAVPPDPSAPPDPARAADQHRKDLAPVVDLYRKVLAIRKQTDASNPSRPATIALATAQMNLANVLVELNDPKADSEAESLYRAAIVARRKIDGGDSHDAAQLLGLLADVCASAGKLTDAARHYREAAAVWRRTGTPAPARWIDGVRATFRALHSNAMTVADYKKAEDVAREFLDLLAELKVRPTVEDALLQPAAYQQQNFLSLARAAGEKAVERLRGDLKADPQERLQLLAFMAGIYHLQAEYKKAIQLANEAMSLLASLPRADLYSEFRALAAESNVRFILAEANLVMGKYPQARAAAEAHLAWCQKWALEKQPTDPADAAAQNIWESRQQVFHLSLILSRLFLAAVYQTERGFSLAAPLYVDRSKEFLDSFPANHQGRPAILLMLANLNLYRKKVDEAEPLLKEARSLLEKLGKTTAPEYAENLCRLGQTALIRGNLGEARKLLEDAQGIWTRAHGAEHIRVAEAKYHLARVCIAEDTQERHKDADRLLQEARTTFEEAFTVIHPWVALCMEEQVVVFPKVGRTAEVKALALQIGEIRQQFPKLSPPKD